MRKNVILSAFYLLSILMCAVRIANYLYLGYCVAKEGQQDIGIVLLVEVIGDFLMQSVGITQVFTMVDLAHQLQVIYRQRTGLPQNACYLATTVLTIGTAIGLLYVFDRDSVFYGDMVLYLGAAIALYSALSYLVVVMQSTATPTFSLMNEER